MYIVHVQQVEKVIDTELGEMTNVYHFPEESVIISFLNVVPL